MKINKYIALFFVAFALAIVSCTTTDSEELGLKSILLSAEVNGVPSDDGNIVLSGTEKKTIVFSLKVNGVILTTTQWKLKPEKETNNYKYKDDGNKFTIEVISPDINQDIVIEVTATSGAFSKTKVVTIKKLDSITSLSSLTISRKADQADTKAIAGGATVDLTKVFDVTFNPETIPEKRLVWSIDPRQNDVATVSIAGVLTPIGVGTVKVKVTSVSNPEVSSATVDFLIEAGTVAVTGLTLTRKTDQAGTKATAGGATVDLASVYDLSVTPPTATDSSVIWSIDPAQETVATITEAGVLTPLVAGTVKVKVTSVSDSGVSSTTDDFVIEAATARVPVTGLTLTRKTDQADTKATAGGATVNLTSVYDLSVTPPTATDSSVIWSIDPAQETVATITEAGVLTPLVAGTVKVKVTSVSDSGVSSATDDFVIEAATVAVTGLTLTRKTDQADTKATAGGATVNLISVYDLSVTPPTATDSSVIWSIDPAQETVATITEAGVLTPLVAGTVKVKVTSVSDSGVSSTTDDFVIEAATARVPVTGLTLTRKTDQADTKATAGGATVNLTSVYDLSVTPPTATDSSVIWSIDPAQETVATITEAGVLTPLVAGTVKVKVTSVSDSGVSSTTDDFVIEAATARVPVTGLTLTRKTDQADTKATAGGATVNLISVYDLSVDPPTATDSSVIWSIDPAQETVATITEAGVLTPLVAGTVKVKVTSVSDSGVSSATDDFVIEAATVAVTGLTLTRKTDQADTKATAGGATVNLISVYDLSVTPPTATDSSVIWSIDPAQETVATITEAGVLTPLVAGTVKVKVTSVSDSGVSSTTDDFVIEAATARVPVTGLTLTRKTDQADTKATAGGATVNLTSVYDLSVTPPTATNSSVIWSIDPAQETVATITEAGVLTPLVAGTVKVKVTSVSDSGVSSATDDFVIEAATVAVTGLTLTRKTDQADTKATAGGATVNLISVYDLSVTPPTATDSSVIWSIDPAQETVATITEAGVLTPLVAGTVKVKVTSVSDSGVSSATDDFVIEAATVAVTGLTLTRKTDQADTKATAGGATVNLISVYDLSVTPPTATDSSVIWSIDPAQETVATITEAGVLTPLVAGTVKVKVTSVSDSGVSSTTDDFVIEAATARVPVTGLTLTRKTDQADTKATAGGATVNLTSVYDLSVTPPTATDSSVIWSIDPAQETVATITEAGVLTPLVAGTVKVKVTSVSDSGVSSTTDDFVIEAATARVPVTGLTLTRKTDQADTKATAGGATVNLISVYDLSVDPPTATDSSVIWSIDPAQETVATITEAGVLTPLVAGTVKVKVTSVSDSGVSSATDDFVIEAATVAVTGLTLTRKTDQADTKATAGGATVNLISVYDLSVTPPTATDSSVIWSIDPAQETVATITEAGVLTPLVAGTVKVKVTSVSDSGVSSTTDDFVIEAATARVPVTGLTLTRKTDQADTKATAGGATVNLTSVYDLSVTPPTATNSSVIWSIDPAQETVATITEAGVLTPLVAGTVKVKVTSVSDSGVSSATDDFVIEAATVAVTGLTLTRKTDQADTKATAGGATVNLISVYDLSVTPPTATDSSVIWSIDPAQETVATITEAGVLTPLVAGTVKVKVTSVSDSGVSSATDDFVIEAATVAVTGLTLTRKTDQADTKATAGGATVNLISVYDLSVTPPTATDSSVIWSIDPAQETVATITEAGVLTPLVAGTVKVKVTSVSDSGVSSATDDFVIEAATVAVTGLTLTRKTDQADTKATAGGATVNLTSVYDLSVTPPTATDSSVIWSIDPAQETVATITEAGVLTPLVAGTVKVKVTSVSDSGVSSTTDDFVIEVARVAVEGVTLTPATLTLSVGDTSTLTATVAPETATDKTVSWSSSDETVATVNQNGLVTAGNMVGRVTITVATTDGDFQAVSTVIVTTIQWIDVEGGEFEMGCKVPRDDNACTNPRELPLHTVQVESFRMAKYEVTNAQYVIFLNDIDASPDGSYTGNDYEQESYIRINLSGVGIEHKNGVFEVKAGLDNHPARRVTWYGARNYAKWAGGRLPTEEEWEYAARGGQESKDYKYSGANGSRKAGWWTANSGGDVHEVGLKVANELGIHDMSGNVNEWCESAWRPTYEPSATPDNTKRVYRGGSFGSGYASLRNAQRDATTPVQPDAWSSTGFRVASD